MKLKSTALIIALSLKTGSYCSELVPAKTAAQLLQQQATLQESSSNFNISSDELGSTAPIHGSMETLGSVLYTNAENQQIRIAACGSYSNNEDVYIGSVYLLNPTDNTLDTSFGTNGLVQVDIDPGFDSGFYNIAIDSENNFICVGLRFDNTPGSIQAAIAKINSSGNLVESFGNSGIVILDFFTTSTAFGVAVDKYDNIYIGGNQETDPEPSTAYIAKYDKNGNLVNDFGDGGIKNLAQFGTIKSICFDPDNNLIFAGNADINGYMGNADANTGELIGFREIRYQTNNSDTNFNGVIISPQYVNNKLVNYIYTCGSGTSNDSRYMLVAKFDLQGNPVNSFNKNGALLIDISNIGFTSEAKSIALYRGGIVMGGFWWDTDQSIVYKSIAFVNPFGVLYSYCNSFNDQNCAAYSNSQFPFSTIFTLNTLGDIVYSLGSYNLSVPRSRSRRGPATQSFEIKTETKFKSNFVQTISNSYLP